MSSEHYFAFVLICIYTLFRPYNEIQIPADFFVPKRDIPYSHYSNWKK